jgi:polysaccharide pyruvyl transferase WcaK-like protein
VTVREDFTKEELLKAGADGGNICVFADPAFGVDPVGERTRGLEILKRDGIRTGPGKMIGVAFRHMYWKWSEDEFYGYAAKLASMCDHIIEKTGAEILFIPNCTYDVDTKYEDDRVIAEYVIGKMKRPERVRSIKGDLTLPDTLALYRLLDMLISNRRHSCIFAAIHGVAMLPMSTGHRWHFAPFARELSVEDRVVSFTDDSLEGLKSKAMDTWDDRGALVEKMNTRLPRLRARARSQVDMLIDAAGVAGQAGRMVRG